MSAERDLRARRAKRRWLAAALGASVVLLLLLALSAFLFDHFAHDLLCRYGQSRWDPSARDCYVPLPEPAEAPNAPSAATSPP